MPEQSLLIKPLFPFTALDSLMSCRPLTMQHWRDMYSVVRAWELSIRYLHGKRVDTMKSFTPTNFVNYRLTAEQKEHFAGWFAELSDDLDEILEAVLMADNRLGITYDVRGDCFIASLTCRDENSPNHAHCVTARYDSSHKAMACVVYKVTVCLADTKWSDAVSDSDYG